MKKLSIVLVILLFLIMVNTIESKAIGIIVKIGRGIAFGDDCRPGNGICFIIIITRTSSNSGLARTAAGTDIELIDGTAELKDGKLYITTSKSISNEAKNERGKFEIAIKENGVKNPVTIDPSVAKELGMESLVVAPGNYSFNGNTITFNTIKSPRDAASGQASGKKSNFAIDEPGTHKTTTQGEPASGQATGKR